MSQKSVKLKAISLVNYKGIDELSAKINGNHFIVFGKNGAGKTSVLEVINRAAVRATASQIADVPIKLGAKNSTTGIVFEIDEDGTKREILIETVHRPSGSVMRLIDLANDGELKPPVQKLQQIIGESHDLAAILDMDGKDQFKELLKVLGGGEAVKNFEAAYDAKYEERKLINRDLKTLELDLKSNEPPHAALLDFRTKGKYVQKLNPLEAPLRPDAANLYIELNNASSHNGKVTNAEVEVARISNEIKELQRQVAEKEERLYAGRDWLEKNPRIETGPIQMKIDAVADDVIMWEQEMRSRADYDAMVDKISAHAGRVEKVKAKEKAKDAIQKEMNDLQEKMKGSVSSLNLGAIVPELRLMNEVDDSGTKPVFRQGIFYVTEDGSLLPFNRKQISYAKCLVAIAKLSSVVNAGKLNFIHIPAWNDLDSESKTELLAFAEENEDLNIQFGIESVEDTILGIKLIEKHVK